MLNTWTDSISYSLGQTIYRFDAVVIKRKPSRFNKNKYQRALRRTQYKVVANEHK